MDDLFCDGHSSVSVRRDPVLIEGQADHHAAVSADQREDFVHGLLFAADGIDHCFSVVNAKGRFHGFRIHRVDLEGQVDHALQRLHGVPHHGGFIDVRQPGVHIKDVGAAVLLGDPLPHDIFQVMFFKGLLKPLFPGRVDPLSDDL